jgi:hypothetical protein
MREQNRLKSVGQLAVVGGWFEQDEDKSECYSLHLSATFKEERFGGTEDSKVHFRVRLNQCEIVVFLPERGNGFRVLERTIARTLPGPAITISDTVEENSRTSVGGAMQVGAKVLAKAHAVARRTTAAVTKLDKSRQSPRMEVLYSKTADMQHCWIASGVGGCLAGSLWDAANEPRFVVADKRPPDFIEKDRALELPPMASVEIRCRREDIEIYDIEFKDLVEQGITQNRFNQDIRMRAAEAFLKSQIQLQGLRVENMGDKFAEVFLAEYLIPLFE